MAPSKTAQPKHSLRKIAVVVATAVSGMSVYAQAAVEPKEDTITVTAAPAPQESAWGPAATIAARQSATGTKTDTPIQKVPQSISVVTAEEMARRIKELEQQLKQEQMRSIVLDQMIDLAEGELKISIRKKSGAKQSK